jgi:hypothetical protein
MVPVKGTVPLVVTFPATTLVVTVPPDGVSCVPVVFMVIVTDCGTPLNPPPVVPANVSGTISGVLRLRPIAANKFGPTVETYPKKINVLAFPTLSVKGPKWADPVEPGTQLKSHCTTEVLVEGVPGLAGEDTLVDAVAPPPGEKKKIVLPTVEAPPPVEKLEIANGAKLPFPITAPG